MDNNVVVFNKVLKIYGGVVTALNKASFTIPRGVVAGLLGPNGSGKTTSFKLILGFLKPDDGFVRVFDLDPWVDEVEVRRRIGYLPEKPSYPDARVIDYLRYVARVRGVDVNEVYRVADLVGISRYLYNNTSELSRGYLQRLGLAQALLGDPELLLLDEPTANLDPGARREILGLVKDLGRELKITIIVATHILPEMQEVADYIVFINRGFVVESAPIDQLAKRYRIEAYYIIYTNESRRVASALINLDYVKGVEITDQGVLARIDSFYTDSFEDFIRNDLSNIVSGYKLVKGELGELYEKLSKIG